MDAKNELAFQRLCHNLKEDRSGMSVCLVDLTVAQIMQLGDSIRGRRGFSHLTLCGGEIFYDQVAGGEEVNALCHFIEQCSVFSMLALDTNCEVINRLSPVIPSLLVEALSRNNNREQKTLVLNGINIYGLIDPLCALMQKGALEVLVLGHLPEIRQDEAAKLTLAIQTTKEGLESLYLKTSLPRTLCESLVAGLATNTSLSSCLLDVLSEENAKPIGTLLESCHSLHYLSLSGVSISPQSLEALSSGLGTESTLTLVDLSKCSLGYDHAMPLATFIKKLRNVMTLILDSNPIGLCCFRALCESLCGHNSLTELSIVDCRIGGDVSGALQRLFLNNHRLKSLSMEKNDLSTCQRQTWEVMAQNRSIHDVWLQDSFHSISSWSDIYHAYERLQDDIELDWSVNENLGGTDRTEVNLYALRSEGKDCSVKLRCDSTSAERFDWLVGNLKRQTCQLKKMTITSRLLSCGSLDFARALMECERLETLRFLQTENSDLATLTSICHLLPGAHHLKRLEIIGFVGGMGDSLRAAVEGNTSLLWIEIPNIRKVHVVQIHYFVIRNRVMALRDAPISLLPLALRHSLIRKPDVLCAFPKWLTFTFLALQETWSRLGIR